MSKNLQNFDMFTRRVDSVDAWLKHVEK